MMTELVVYLLEIIEIDVNESENAAGSVGFFEEAVKMLFEREAVLDVGEHIELRPVDEIGVEARSLDGQGRQLRCRGKRLLLLGLRGCAGIECGEDGAQCGAGASGNRVFGDPQT
jgi:hypothetical protein